MKRSLALLSLLVLLLAAWACNTTPSTSTTPPQANNSSPEQFVADAEKKLFDLSLKLGRAQWVQSNFITEDTEALAADANKDFIAAVSVLAEDARRFDGQKVSDDVARKLKLLKLATPLPAPSDAKERDELTKLAAAMEGDYGKGK